MKTLTHWQWLVLSKGHPYLRPLKHQIAFVPPASMQQVSTFYGFNLNGWFGEIGVGPTPVGRAQKAFGRALEYSMSTSHPSFRANRGFRATRSLDHCFLAYGLLRFGEELGGGTFSLLIIRNLLETASAAWLMEVFFFHSRLAQLFKLSRARKPLSITAPGHPWYGGLKWL